MQGWAHSSHELKFHAGTGIWFCGACGPFAAQQLTGLMASECTRKASDNRIDDLNKIFKGIWPKAYSKAEVAKRDARYHPLSVTDLVTISVTP